jgi:hypothetical protein
MQGWTVRATDGNVGRVADFALENALWKIGFLVADTSDWLPRSQAVFPIRACRGTDETGERLRVEMTRGEVERCPEDVETGLRRARRVFDYTVQALNADIGRVGDFIVDDASWEIRYVVVHTGEWLPLKKILLPVSLIESASWQNGMLSVCVRREAIAASPAWDEATPIRREFEQRLHAHYGLPGYWERQDYAHTG